MMKQFSNLFCLCMVLIGISFHADSQNLDHLNVTNVVPPSPEVAAMGKYIDMPVGYSTGVAEVTIPIYTVSNGALSLPLALSYNTSGIKVEEAATWVGLGWNLSSGGSISRVVRGQPDDYSSYGYMYTSNTAAYILSLDHNNSTRVTALNDGYTGDLDFEPDIYIFSAMGYSGKFYWDQQQAKFIFSPNQRIKIDYTTASGFITGFLLTLPNGAKCYFGKSQDNSRTAYETYTSQTTYNINDGTHFFGPPSNTPQHITGWQLMDAVSPTNKSIKFYYTNYSATDFGRGGESADRAISGCDAATGAVNSSFYYQYLTKSALQRISFDAGDVYFVTSSSNREDAAGDQKALDSIVIKNKDGKRIKSFLFSYHYESTDAFSVDSLYSVEGTAANHLFLDSIKEIDSANTLNLPPYVFTYNPEPLPSRLSTSQDYWGYYNGSYNPDGLIPKVPVGFLSGSDVLGPPYFPGADRRIDTTYAMAGILTKVKYPTGGTSEYFYEANQAPMQSIPGILQSYLTDHSKFFYKSSQFQLENDPYTYVDSFEVGDVYGNAKLTVSFETCSEFNTFDCHVQGAIIGITDPYFYYSINSSESYITLPKGKYKTQVSLINLYDELDPNFGGLVQWLEDPDPSNFMVGGLRIKKIINSDSAGKTLVKTLVYKNFSDPTLSSGVLYNIPTHAYFTYCGYYEGENPSNPDVLKIVSQSALPLASSDGQAIRYENVTEYRAENNSSYVTEYTFSADKDYIVLQSYNYPAPTPVFKEWRSGLLLHKKELEKVGTNSYRLVREEANFYASFGMVTKDTFGIRMAPYVMDGFDNLRLFGVTPYKFVSEWYLLDSSSVKDIDAITTSTKYYYNDRYLLSKTKSLNSKGVTIINRMMYPYDYNNISGTNISDLKDRNIIESPIKQETSANGKLTKGIIMTYNSAGLPVGDYAYENAALSDTSAHSMSTLIPSNYILKTSLYYDINADLIQATASGNNNRNFIWDYHSTYPIARVDNADSASIAYTSFEADGKGGWSYSGGVSSDGSSPTGAKCYNLSGGNITKSGLANTTYVVCYWSKSGNAYSVNGSSTPVRTGSTVDGWTYYEHEVSSTSITISGSNYIDEVRLFPKGALMTTFTYHPLIGMTGQCDVNNRITYYEYDSFGRLKIVRDQEKRILKKIQYKYQATSTQ
jgi:hypothetical protein